MIETLGEHQVTKVNCCIISVQRPASSIVRRHHEGAWRCCGQPTCHRTGMQYGPTLKPPPQAAVIQRTAVVARLLDGAELQGRPLARTMELIGARRAHLVNLLQLAVRVQGRARVIRVHRAVEPAELRAAHGRGAAATVGVGASDAVGALGCMVHCRCVSAVLSCEAVSEALSDRRRCWRPH